MSCLPSCMSARAALLTVFAVALTAHASSAQAYTVLANASATANAGHISDNQLSGVLVDVGQAANSALAETLADDGTPLSQGAATAFAAPGVLKALARSATVSTGPGGATGNSTASFTDRLQLSSSSLTGDALVSLLFFWEVGGSLSGCTDCPTQGSVSSSLSISGGTLSGPAPTYSQSFLGGANNLSALNRIESVTLNIALANAIGLSGNLSAFSGSQGNGFSSVDFSGTANLFIDVLTDGVSFAADSGYNYRRPSTGGNSVPEPNTALLLLAAALGLALFRRRPERPAAR